MPTCRSAIARFPHVLTTYRLTEHHTAGGMSRYAVAPRRTAAGVLRRDLARAGRRDRRGARRLGHASPRRAASSKRARS